MALLWAASGLEVGGPLVSISPFHWTVAHIPLIERYDWPGVVATALVGIVLLGLGVELFARRDLGVTAGLRLPGLPAALLGVRGPVGRAFGEQLVRATWWGIGLGLWGALLSSLIGAFAERIAADPTLTTLFSGVFPGYDFTTAGGWLQLYVQLFFIAAGLAATTFVSAWAADERSGRLEELLAVPLGRARWAVSGGLAAGLAVVLMTALYVGVAIGGLWRSSLAAELAALLVVATFLLDLLAPALDLPDALHELALTAHFGEPMIGRWDAAGVVASIAIAVGGVLLGAWGMRRRDVAR
jgi:putative exporter of polyketide antibiotics